MKEYFKIAWRNIWRNRRRSLITIASVLFALFLALIMRSMQLAQYGQMIESAVKSSTGYIQIHDKGYWEDKTIDNTFEISPELQDRISATPNVSRIIPRLEAFALASSGLQTKGVAIIGTMPMEEDVVSGLKGRLVRGEYLSPDDSGVLLPEGLANYLQSKPGDTVVLLGQGYHGVTASGAYPVRGIVSFIQPDQNNSMVYMSLTQAQTLYAAEGRLTSMSILLADPGKLEETRASLRQIDPENLEYMTWREMLWELLQAIEGDNISGQFMLGILYMVVGFGILGTVLMMTMERKKEFGIMVAVGMRRSKLLGIMLIETCMIGLIGILAGVSISIPVLVYLKNFPIKFTGEAAKAMLEYNMPPEMPVLLEPGFFITQALVVFIITLLTALYPVRIISRFNIVKAIKG